MFPSLALVAAVLLAAPRPPLIDLGQVGTVSLSTSCQPSVQGDFNRAMALLHSFFYDEARTAFSDVSERDPSCALAHWGVAMTYYHPLWAPPLPEERKAGAAASLRAKELGGKTPLEQGLIRAMEAYWNPIPSAPGKAPLKEGVASCHGGAPALDSGAEAFRAQLEALRERAPEDVEVNALYALSLLGTAPKEDRTLARQRQAATLLEGLWRQHPEHPGVVHYLIHAYDYPELARSGLKAAEAYARVAPQIPHALHMPSHIFVRLGMWDEDVVSNRSALAAAERWMAVRHPGATFSDALHASDYLLYGYLQQGRDELVDEEVRRMTAVDQVYPPRELAAAVARALSPVRASLEREHWEEASKLEVAPIEAFAAYPFVRGFVEYAHGMGAARLGRVELGRKASAELGRLVKMLPPGPLGYWTRLFETYQLSVLAWVAHADKHDDEAVHLLERAASLEDALGPHPVMPGPLLPAREQLGELLYGLHRDSSALAAYQASLVLYPGRLRSVQGAMRAAQRAGDVAATRAQARALSALLAKSGRSLAK